MEEINAFRRMSNLVKEASREFDESARWFAERREKRVLIDDFDVRNSAAYRERYGVATKGGK